MGEPYLLLIEENQDDIYLMLRQFRRFDPGVRVKVISDSAEALAYLEEADELPCALLLGLKFIRLSGLELLTQLRNEQRTRELPVIMLTGGVEEHERVGRKLANASPVACLTKPVEPGVLVSVLGSLGIPLSPALAT